MPALLQSLFGYDAYVSGLVQSPGGIFSIIGLIVVGSLISRGVDARYMIVLGLLTMATGNYWMALMNLDISPLQVIWPRVVLYITGLSMIFVSVILAAFMYTPTHLRGMAVGLMASAPQRGGQRRHVDGPDHSVAQREQFHTARVGESLDPFNPALSAYTEPGPGVLPSADGRSGRSSVDEPAIAG